ncbi:MAG: hypothetical protein AAF349_06675 [Cyanobacteria bacterium P01_A01_bin.68]
MKYTLLYYPELAGALRELGIPHPGEAAIFLSQLSYWLKKEDCGRMTRDGKHWIYNTYEKWVLQIKSLTISQFGKMIRALARVGLIEKTTFAEQKHSLKKEKPVGFSSWNNTTWVTLCVEKIKELTGWSPFSNETEETPEKASGDYIADESLEPSPQADILNRTSDDSESNDWIFHSESSSIYKENLSLTKEPKFNSEKEKKENSPKTGGGSNPQCSTDKKQLPVKPKISNKDNSPRCLEVRNNRINRDNNEALAQEVWEIAIGKPFPVFLNWRANCHYKPQGGKWESDAYGNAYSEFYRNREKTTAVLFPQFMNEVRGITEKVHIAQSSSSVAANVLPSWFIESLPDATPAQVKQLMENLDVVISRGTRIVLPNKSNTPSDMTVDYHEAHSQVDIKPLPQLEAPVLKGVEAPMLGGVEERAKGADCELPSADLQQTLARKQAQWNAPILRDRVRRWAESTPGVVITESGPQLETAIETNLNNAAGSEFEINRNNTVTDKVETTLNNSEGSEVEINRNRTEALNPLVEKQLPKVETSNHGASTRGDVEVNNPSTSNNADVETSNNSLSSNSPMEVETSSHGASMRSDVETNSHCASTRGEVEINNHGASVRGDVENNNQLTHKHTDDSSGNGFALDEEDIETNVERAFLGADVLIDDPWETSEPLLVNSEDSEEEVISEKPKAKPSMLKLMLALWDNIYELGQLVLNASESELIAAASQCTPEQIAHIKKAATTVWQPGLNRDADYKGERVEIWEVGQSQTVKVLSENRRFLKVKRRDLQPWLGI